MFTIQRIIARKRLLAQMQREEEEKKRLEGLARKAEDKLLRVTLEDGAKPKASDEQQTRPKFPPRKGNPRVRLNTLELQLFHEARSVTISLTLSLLQAKGLRTTWSKMNVISMNTGRGTVSMVQRALDKLLSKNNQLRLIFYKTAFLKRREESTATTVHDHANYITIWIEGVIERINDAVLSLGKNVSFKKKRVGKQNITIKLLLPAGEKHFQLRGAGLEPKHFDQLALHLVDELYNIECVRAYPDALSAWRILLATLFDNIIADLGRYRTRKPPRAIEASKERVIEACTKQNAQLNNPRDISENQPQSSMAEPEVPWFKEWYV